MQKITGTTFRRKAIPGFHTIEGRLVHTDSLMEAKIIQRLVNHGFFGYKWQRYRFGVAASVFRYTPDVHLSILHDSMNRRALVEFKPRATTEFNKKARMRMLASAHFFKDALCFLYIEKTKQWYLIERDGKLLRTEEPTPGIVPVTKLPRPRIMVPIIGAYGRIYWERPGMFLLHKSADGIQFVVEEILRRPRHRNK